jgi:hypothetical protein
VSGGSALARVTPRQRARDSGAGCIFHANPELKDGDAHPLVAGPLQSNRAQDGRTQVCEAAPPMAAKNALRRDQARRTGIRLQPFHAFNEDEQTCSIHERRVQKGSIGGGDANGKLRGVQMARWRVKWELCVRDQTCLDGLTAYRRQLSASDL